MTRRFDEEERRRLLAELQKRQGRIQSLDWDRLMFPEQRKFIEDPSRLKVAVCSRRAGKSHGVALALLKAAYQYPGSFPIYMNGNRAQAKVMIWPALRDIDQELKLGLRFDQATSDVKLPNAIGSVIKVYGVGTRREMDKIRGGKPPLSVLDEAQNMGSDMAYLISQVVLPSTADYKSAVLVTGTPNASCTGPFHDIAHGDSLSDVSHGLKWSVHNWTMEENPYIDDPEEEYDLACAANGWTRQSPGFLREMKGKWVRDNQGMAFYMNGSMVVDKAPLEKADDWVFNLGIDLGTKDPCAYTIGATSNQLGATYILQSYKDQFTTLQAGTEVERIMEQYPLKGPFPTDSGGQGAAFIAQWKTTHPNIPAVAVKKAYGSVDMGINIINADARAGKLFFVKSGCEQLIDELQMLMWDEKTSATGVRRIKRGDAFPDHCADSFRYMYTRVRNVNTHKMVRLSRYDVGTPEWRNEQAAKAKQAVLNEKPGRKKAYWQTLVARRMPRL